MKKSDLKTGMRVEYRDGTIRIVMLNTSDGSIFSGSSTRGIFSNYSDDLIRIDAATMNDVVKVYDKPSICSMLDLNAKGELLWTRGEPIELIDGEIYSLKYTNSKCIHINRQKGSTILGSCHSSILVTTINGEKTNRFYTTESIGNNVNTTPATPKQKAKLINAEIKNGYLWDCKKKKLIKF